MPNSASCCRCRTARRRHKSYSVRAPRTAEVTAIFARYVRSCSIYADRIISTASLGKNTNVQGDFIRSISRDFRMPLDSACIGADAVEVIARQTVANSPKTSIVLRTYLPNIFSLRLVVGGCTRARDVWRCCRRLRASMCDVVAQVMMAT